MNFTKAQQNAIDERDSSLIISAGAGSGKTAVLTERILSRICDEKDECNIDDFLIVTFTNAAAKELSFRIRKKLSSRAAENPGCDKILKNIALLPLARISTINSFCYEMVRENFQRLGLSASVRIADEAEMGVIKNKLMNETISEYFETNGDDKIFLAAYEIFSSSKSDKNFVDTLLDFDTKLRNFPSPDMFMKRVLDEYIQVYQTHEFFDTSIGKKLRQDTERSAKKTISSMDKLIEISSKYKDLTDKYIPALEAERDFARRILDCCAKGYEHVKSEAENSQKTVFKAVRNAENPTAKEIVRLSKSAVSDDFRKMLGDKFSCNINQLQVAAKDTVKIISKIYDLIKIFGKKLDERKSDLSILEFSDCERYTLSLLVESTEPFCVTNLAHKMRGKFSEIYIDEYQDVNPLQDMIFRAISREDETGSEKSRFMVGDIKQSIYGFRGASSDIFMNYRDSFSDLGEISTKKRIFMSDNFRCAESVIGLTNMLFSGLMSDYFTDGDRLNFARLEDKKINKKAELLAFSFDKDAANGYSALELEATMICRKIFDIVGNDEYTDSNGNLLNYSDIGILARSKTALKTYELVLSAYGIPVYSDVGESFYDKPEINLCLCILNAIDNPERDIYLAGFMRSAAGEFLDDELVEIKHEFKKMSLYHSVLNYCDAENELGNKCRRFVEELRALRSISRGKSADKLIWYVFEKYRLLSCACFGDTELQRMSARKNLMKLYNLSRDFAKTSFRGVGAFLDYLRGSAENNDVKSERVTDENCVRLMTIHASKGLEFPVCFVSNMSKRYNKSDEKKSLVYSEKAGVATMLCDADGLECTESNSSLVSINTPFRTYVSSEIDKTLRDEEVRILYVALTRARDYLFMTGHFTKKIENAMNDALCSWYTGIESGNNYLSLVLSSLANQSVLAPYYEAAESSYKPTASEAEKFVECHYYSCERMMENFLGLTCFDDELEETYGSDEIDEELLNRLQKYNQVYIDSRRFPAKLTVSRLKTGLLDEEMTEYTGIQVGEIHQDLMPEFIKDVKEATGADKGTAMHMFMQFAVFENCENNGCGNEAKRLKELGFIDEMQFSLLDIKRLNSFFKSRFYKEIKDSKSMFREQRFNLEVSDLNDSSKSEVLVQGVIDLFYENEDGSFTVVDFKTDRVFGDDAEDVLIQRHKTQLMYYKRAVEQMTGCSVRDALLYSFSLMKQISVK